MPEFPELTSSGLEMPQDMVTTGEVTGMRSQARRLREEVSSAPPALLDQQTAPAVTLHFIDAGVMQVCGCFERLQAGNSTAKRE